ncbi:site-specific integrase [Bradyrhizobium sp. AUGA SZCCT0169]|uniref:tyrosine-type recombinase/integrase n=1 Tax=Bradyrhizobium sp. AUGA SZCCT0169 TaxID=2807663 RepID=UPI001BA76B4D|nr:site-specific integrase [Bradyrhizobium sp. AUGA SZCCT0169]MBR1249182.1 site-specific integrase [Bradyrhizobium sp. AUGA SZCCT0169]
MSKRSYGDGGIEQRGENVFRLRYRIGGRKFSKTVRGKLTDARKELRALIRSGDTDDHVDPTKMTVGQWIDQWIHAGAPGRKKKRVGQSTLERYEQLLRVHIKPTLGARPLQKLAATQIDKLYNELDALLDEKGERLIAPMTLHHVHVCFNSCLSTAERKGLLRANPMRRAEQVPSGCEGDHGEALEQADLATLVTGFRASATMYAPVAVDAATGARRNELLAFRWTDLDVEKKTLRVERALEMTKKFGIRVKLPKTKRGLRTIALDDVSLTILLEEKERQLRIYAGIPDGVDVDLSLIGLPEDALIFPALPAPGEKFSFTTPRNPRNFSKEFARRAKRLGFEGFTFHHIRGTHGTLLLDRKVPVHVVAERLGDDPAVLLRNYAKRKRNKTANDSISADINALVAGFLGK